MLGEHDLKIYNKLVGRIYASNSLRELRLNVLSGLQQLIPYDSAAFFLVNPQTLEFAEPLSFGLDIKSFTAYRDYYQTQDEYKRAVFSGGFIPMVDRSSDYLDYNLWKNNEHRADFLLPQGIFHIACMQVIHEHRITGEISLHRNKLQSDFTDQEMLLLRLLHEHVNVRFASLSLLPDGWLTAVNTFKDPAQDLILCLFDSHYHLQGSTPAASGFLAQTLLSGQTVYSYLKDTCYNLSQAVKQPSRSARWSTSGNLNLKSSVCRYQVILFHDEAMLNSIRYLVLLHSDSPNNSEGEAHLTRREAEIASLIARGRTNKQIAADLEVSENTIKTLVKKLFVKMGVHSRSELTSEIYKITPANHRN